MKKTVYYLDWKGLELNYHIGMGFPQKVLKGAGKHLHFLPYLILKIQSFAECIYNLHLTLKSEINSDDQEN